MNEDYNEFSLKEEDDSSQVEIIFPSERLQDPDPLEDGNDEEDAPEDLNQHPRQRGQGRPKILRTGLRGRPKKQYHEASCREEIDEVANLAEIPLEDAVLGPHAEEWYQAIVSEMKSIIKNNTWTIVNRPEDHKVIGSRIVLRNKYKHDGTLDRRKARVFAKGYSQKPGVDFNETFAPVARFSSIRTIAALAAEKGMILNQFDITTAYLNGVLKEEVFMEVPKYTIDGLKRIIISETANNYIGKIATEMLKEFNEGDKVCLLKKALYGLRQAGRCWNNKINEELIKFGAKRSTADPCVYFKGDEEKLLLIAVYVDDIIVAS